MIETWKLNAKEHYLAPSVGMNIRSIRYNYQSLQPMELDLSHQAIPASLPTNRKNAAYTTDGLCGINETVQ